MPQLGLMLLAIYNNSLLYPTFFDTRKYVNVANICVVIS